MTQTTVSPARRAETAAQLRRGRILRTVRSILRHLLLALLAAIWLVPILWLLVTSFSTDRGINVRQFFPASYTLRNYVNILFHPDSVAQFPRWFTNTLVVACFNCVISTCFVLMVAYALSCCRFKGRKLIQNLSVSVNLFPGVLAMIAVYFVLKYLNLTNSYAGLIMVYAGSSGLGYLICKGFFDTIPISLREAAKLDGASDARVFFQVVLPMSKPILVYTIGSLAGMSRYMRACMLEVLRQDYILTAQAKGLSPRTIIWRHALRNALLPVITLLGLSVPGLIGGSVIIESIFALPGLGQLFYAAVMARDYTMIMGNLVLGAVLTLLGNLLADVCYGLADPRIRSSREVR